MADLLTPAQRQMLQDALDSVTDTLHKTPIKIIVPGVSLDIRRVNDDRPEVEYDVLCLVSANGDEHRENISGAQDVMEIEAKINIKDLQDVNLVDANKEFLFSEADSYLQYASIRYKIIAVSLEQFIVRIEARREPNKRV